MSVTFPHFEEHS